MSARSSRGARAPGSTSRASAGYDEGDPEGHVYTVITPADLEPAEQHDSAGGITTIGARELIDRLRFGFDPPLLDIGALAGIQHRDSLHLAIPVHALPVAACVDLAAFLMSFTIAAQSITTAVQGCAGAIDIATITADEGLTFVRRKATDPVAVPDLSQAALVEIHRARPTLSISTSRDPGGVELQLASHVDAPWPLRTSAPGLCSRHAVGSGLVLRLLLYGGEGDLRRTPSRYARRRGRPRAGSTSVGLRSQPKVGELARSTARDVVSGSCRWLHPPELATSRQHENAMAANSRQAQDRLKMELYNKIADRIEAANSPLVAVSTLPTSLVGELAWRSQVWSDTGRIPDSVRLLELRVEYRATSRSIIQLMSVLETHAVVMPDFSVFRDLLSNVHQRITRAFGDFSLAASEFAGSATEGPIRWPPSGESTRILSGLAASAQAAGLDAIAAVWDLRVEAQNSSSATCSDVTSRPAILTTQQVWSHEYHAELHLSDR